MCGTHDEVDRLHVKIIRIVGINYLDIIDVYHHDQDSIEIDHYSRVHDHKRYYSYK